MIPEQFLIYAINPGGWLTPNMTYSSDWHDAHKMLWEAARDQCLRHRDHEGNFQWLPINEDDLLRMVNG